MNESSVTDCIARWDRLGDSANAGQKEKQAKEPKSDHKGGKRRMMYCKGYSSSQQVEYVRNHKDIFRAHTLQEHSTVSFISVQMSAWHQWEILLLPFSAWGPSPKRTLPVTSHCQSLSKSASLWLEIVLFLSSHFFPPYWYISLMIANVARPALKAPALLF